MIVCDLYGARREIAPFRQSGRQTFSAFDADKREPDRARPCDDTQKIREEILVHILRTIERYGASGRFTAKQLRVIRRRWLERWSVDRVARAEGVSRQAIHQRIVGRRSGQGGVLNNAPEFATWWFFINRNRCRR